jgi:hypothetical protein
MAAPDHPTKGQTMPTDLPPDYKPKPAANPDNPADPNNPGSPTYPPGQGDDALDRPTVPQPGPGVGAPGPGPDVFDPPGWSVPPIAPGSNPGEGPTPASTPTF